MDLPAEYLDREQTFFKHQVLRHYLRSWSQKLASVSRTGRAVHLWYVDCFAGPWESRTDDRSDTSVAIGKGVQKQGKNGAYLEVKIDGPMLPEPVTATMQLTPSREGVYTLLWKRAGQGKGHPARKPKAAE